MIAKAEVKELDELKREISIELTPEQFNQTLENKFAELKKETTLEGFRKGKIPLDMIKSKFGDSAKQEVLNDLIKNSYPEAIKQNGLRVASFPTITGVDLAEDGTFRYTATMEVFPEIKKVDYSKLEISEADIEVKDSEVDEYVEQLLKHHSDLREVTRPAQDSDIITADLEKLSDSKMLIKDSSFADSQIDLSNPSTIKEFREQIPGMKSGDEKEIVVKYADDYPDPNFAGAEIKYLCKVKKVNERIMPELNDGFAKTAGIAETALEMKLKIRSEIQRQKTESLIKQQKGMLIGQICKRNPIAVPVASVNDYLDNIVEEIKQKGEKFNEEELRNHYRPIGENSFRWNMLYLKLSEQEKIEVSATDTENLIKRFAENYKMTPEQAKEALQKSGRIADLRESLLEDKVLDFLIGQAKVVKTDK